MQRFAGALLQSQSDTIVIWGHSCFPKRRTSLQGMELRRGDRVELLDGREVYTFTRPGSKILTQSNADVINVLKHGNTPTHLGTEDAEQMIMLSSSVCPNFDLRWGDDHVDGLYKGIFKVGNGQFKLLEENYGSITVREMLARFPHHRRFLLLCCMGADELAGFLRSISAAATQTITRTAVRTLPRVGLFGVRGVAEAVPVLGLVVGIACATGRLGGTMAAYAYGGTSKGMVATNVGLAGAEVAAGVLSLFPGPGTVASISISASVTGADLTVGAAQGLTDTDKYFRILDQVAVLQLR